MKGEREREGGREGEREKERGRDRGEGGGEEVDGERGKDWRLVMQMNVIKRGKERK